MNRLWILPCLVACGGGRGPELLDAQPAEPTSGFTNPTAPLMANRLIHRGVLEETWEELGPADLTCLNTPPNEAATSVAVNLSSVVREFHSGDLFPGAEVIAFRGQNVADVIDTTTADVNAKVTLTIPTGVRRFGFLLRHASAVDSFVINQKVAPDTPSQSLSELRIVSQMYHTILPSDIGSSRRAGTGVLIGTIRDCQNHEISNFIATLSTTRGVPAHVPGANTHYFTMTGFPAWHTAKPHGGQNGMFLVVGLQPTASAFVQVWGYKTVADVASDDKTLVAEFETNVIADTYIAGSYEPLRQK